MKKFLLLFLVSALLIFSNSAYADILEVDGYTYDPDELVEDVLLGGGISVTSVTFFGLDNSWLYPSVGTFDGEGTDIGLDEGIFLSSGFVSNASMTNTYPNMTGEIYTDGDDDLDILIDPYVTMDKTILEFEFVPIFETVEFRYVFASEEYREWVCSQFNDVFGFFVSGPGIDGEDGFENDAINIAIVPNTTDVEVAINSVNDGCHDTEDGTDPICPSVCTPSNTMYFNCNVPESCDLDGETVEFDGYTDVFTARITNLEPCETYRIKLAVADAGDRLYDSGVFLEAGSFTSVGEYGGTEVTVCSGEDIQIGPDEVSGLTYTWTDPNGYLSSTSAANPVVNITNTSGEPVDYTFPLEISDCISTTFTVTVNPEPTPDITGDEEVCPNSEGVEYYIDAISDASYTWTVAGNISIASGTSSSTATMNFTSAGSATITVAVTNADGCVGEDTFEVTINEDPPDPTVYGYYQCEEETVTYTPVYGDDSAYDYEWSVTGGTIVGDNTNAQFTIAWGTVPGDYEISVLVTDKETGCEATYEYPVSLNYKPTAEFTGDISVCAGGQTSYSATDVIDDGGEGGYESEMFYSWSVTGGTIVVQTLDGEHILVEWPTTGGSATVSLIQTSYDVGVMCTNETEQVITIVELSPEIYCGDDETDCSACANEEGQIFYTDADEDLTYEWSISGGTIVSNLMPYQIEVDWGDVSPGSISLTVTEIESGCTGTAVMEVTLNENPDPIIMGDWEACEDGTGSQFLVINPEEGDTYSWTVDSPGTIVGSATSSSISVDWDGAGSGYVTCEVTNSSGCTATEEFEFYVYPNPDPEITGDNSVCAGESMVEYSCPLVVRRYYDWSVTGGTIVGSSTGNSITVDWGDAGSGTVSVIATERHMEGLLECTGTDELTVTINPLPEPVIAGNADVCDNATGEIYETTNNTGSSFIWFIHGNGSITNGEYTNRVTVNLSVGSATLTVYETDVNGCENSDDFVVTTHEYPEPSIIGTNALCEGSRSSQYYTEYDSDNTYSWTVVGGTMTAGSDPARILVDWAGSGTGSVEVTETTPYGCESTDFMTIELYANPEPEITGTETLCELSEGEMYSTPATEGSTFSWTVSGGTIVGSATGNSITVNWGDAGSGVVQVTETSADGCVGMDAMGITLYPNPEPSISGSIETCQNGETLSYSTPSVSGHEYSWSITGGSFVGVSNTSSVSVIWGSPGTGTLMVTETTEYGCEETDEIQVTILENPEPVISGLDEICEYESSVVYTVAVDNSGREFTYLWEVTGGTIAGLNTGPGVTVNWGGAGTGTVKVTETSQYGCVGEYEMSVTILRSPTPAISGKINVCDGEEAVAYQTNAVTGDTYAWTVSGGTIVSGQGTNTILVNWGTAGAGNVSITQTSQDGCVGEDDLDVMVNPNPEPMITGTTGLCEGDEGLVYQTENIAGYDYEWSVSGGTLVSGQGTNSITVDWGGVGTGMVEVLVTSEYGCEGSDELYVDIYPYPTPEIMGETEVCARETGAVYYTYENSPDNNYLWTVTGGNISTGQGTSRIVVTWGEAGTGTVSLVESNDYGCSSSDELDVTIHPLPDVYIEGETIVCADEEAEYRTNVERGTTVLWSVSGGTIIGNNSGITCNVKWGSAGTGTVTLTRTNSETGCSNSNEITVTVYPIPQPRISGDQVVCGKSRVTYTANNEPGTSNEWLVLRGEIIGENDGNSILVEWDALGSGLVRLTRTSPEGCSNSDEIEVTINRMPQAQITGDTDPCSGEIATYETSNTPGADYQWSVTGGTIVGPDDEYMVDVEWGNPGSGVVYLTKTSAEGCEDSRSRQVDIKASPSANITGEIIVCVGQTTTYDSFIENGSGITSKWTLSGGGTIDGPDDRSAVDINWTTVGTYKVQVTKTNQWGCSETSDIEVSVVNGPEPEINGTTSVCLGDDEIYSTPDVANMTNEWTVEGATLQSGNTGNSIDVLFDQVGNVTITVKQTNTLNGCEGIAEIEIIVNPLPDVQLSSLERCLNDAPVTLTQGTPEGGTYDGPGITGNNFDPAAAGVGTHTVTYTYTDENGCTGTAEATFTVHPVPDKPTITIEEDIATSSADEGNQWYKDGSMISGATDKTLKLTEEGTYSVVVTNEFGCESEASDGLFFDPTGVEDLAKHGINIFPNPTDGQLRIEFVSEIPQRIELRLTNLVGNLMLENGFDNFSGKFVHNLDLQDYRSGVYILELRIGSKVYHQKIVLNR